MRGSSSVSLRLDLFGGLTAATADGVTLRVASRKSLAIFSYLALTKNGTETRERLAGLLWSDRAEEQARASLRQCVKHLRAAFKSIGFTGFSSTRNELRIDPSLVRIDLRELRSELEHGVLSAALLDGSAIPERILYGYESLDLSFASWLELLRKAWQDDLTQSLEEIMRSNQPDIVTAERAAGILTKIDPTHEEAHRHLIRAHAGRGNTSAALDQYKALWDLLEVEYDMEPSEETELLIAALKAGSYVSETPRVEQPAVEAHLPTDGRLINIDDNDEADDTCSVILPLIGIAPFAQGGPWDHDLYLIDGFRRDLISSLVRFREWVVVEVNSTVGKAVTPKPSASKEDVLADYLLEGAYFQEGSQINLVITLKDASSAKYIWSEIINLTLEGWFSARRQLVSRVSISLNVYLSAGRLSDVGTRPDVSQDIYDRWLRGQGLLYNWRPSSHRTAIEIFRQIVREAPSFSPGYSALVQLLNSVHIVCPGVYRTEERHRQALDLARTAVELDPLDSRAQLCLGWAYAMNGRFEQSILHYSMACELNSNDIWTLVSAALGLAYVGATDEATQCADQALKFAPNLTPIQWGYIAGVHYQAGDLLESVEAINRIGERIHYLLAWKASALGHLGDRPDAHATYSRFVELVSGLWCSEQSASASAIRDWLLHCFPIRDEEARRRLRAGLEAAGADFPR